MRIVIAKLMQETATFNPAPTRYEDFEVHFGQDMLEVLAGTKTEIAGACRVFDEADDEIEIIPSMAAWSVSGGCIETLALDRLTDDLVASLASLRDVDGVYLCFHGAMAGVDEGDPEGRALQRIREAVGDVPIVVSLDLHAVISDRLVRDADVLVPYHTYPHDDHFETGQRAANVLLRLVRGDAKPTVARVRLPMLVRGDELLTATGRFGEAIQACRDVEGSPTGLAAGVIIGNAFTDVPDLQSNVLVTTNDDQEEADRQARSIAEFMWEHRRLFVAELTSLSESIELATKTDGLTVFSDAADATASGASGDSNAILIGLVKSKCPKRSLVPIVDAAVAAEAHSEGVGAELEVKLGGSLDPGRFRPFPLRVTVTSLHDGSFEYENGTLGAGGPTAVLSAGAITILVTSRPVYVVGRNVFLAHNLDPANFDLVVVKSPNGFRTHSTLR